MNLIQQLDAKLGEIDVDPGAAQQLRIAVLAFTAIKQSPLIVIGETALTANFQTPGQKHDFLQRCRAAITELGAGGYGFAMEAWSSPEVGVAPSESDFRQTVFMFGGIAATGRVSAMFDETMKLDVVTTEAVVGAFCELLPEPQASPFANVQGGIQ